MTNPTNETVLSRIIGDEIRGEQDGQGRHARLTVALYNSPSFNRETVVKWVKQEGSDYRKAVATFLSDLSSAYAEKLATIAAFKKGKDMTDAAKADAREQIIMIQHQINAANMLFKRALYALLALYQREASHVEISKTRVGSIKFLGLNEDRDKPGKFLSTRGSDMATGALLVRIGEKLANALRPASRRVAAAGTTKGQRFKGVNSALDLVDTFLAKSDGKPFTDYEDDTFRASATKVFDNLLLSMFRDDTGAIDRAALLDHVSKLKLPSKVKVTPRKTAASKPTNKSNVTAGKPAAKQDGQTATA